MLSLLKSPISNISLTGLPHQRQSPKHLKFPNLHLRHPLPNPRVRHLSVLRSSLTPWEPTPMTYSPTDEADPELLETTSNIFETLPSQSQVPAKVPVPPNDPPKPDEKTTDPSSSKDSSFLKWPLWILGPACLLATGVVPTLWLPISSIFLGPNMASLLSLVGLDCIFNLGATLFLLTAHSTTRPRDPTRAPRSSAPFSYQFWNMFASFVGYIVPLALLFGSEKGFLQPQLPHISFLVLLGPYLLLLSVQILTEALTWHWQSPVWLVTPVIYEAYRVLQLMRGLKLGAEMSAPGWMVDTIRGLVCWWVLILGLQLMRVAWFAGFTARAKQDRGSSVKAAPSYN